VIRPDRSGSSRHGQRPGHAGGLMAGMLLAGSLMAMAGIANGQDREPQRRDTARPLIEEVVTETREEATQQATDGRAVPATVRPETERSDTQRPTTEPVTETPAPLPATDTRQQESGPDRPRVERGGSLMGRGPASLPPSAGSDAEAPSAIPSVARDTASRTGDFEPGELVLVSDDMPAAQAVARDLAAYRLRIKSRRALPRLGLVISVFRLPNDADTLALLAEIRRQAPDLSLDVNQRYQLMAGARQRYGQAMIGLPEGDATCLNNVRVGLLDTTVNLAHPALAGQAIDLMQFADSAPAPGDHGTAIASLWVGAADQGFTPLMSQAALSVAAVFRQRGNVNDTTTDILAGGLDWLLGQEVDAINLSLGGRENRILDRVLQQLLAEDILLVAAAGNLGPEGPAVYPAAHPGVVAVTAVDANQRPYERANRGDYLDFAAPGVQVWAASENGTAYHTGTSFAAPFVLAALMGERRLGRNGLQSARESALDLGPPGKDTTYGWGLVRWPAGCG